MKMKNLLIGMAVALSALLFVMGCPQEGDDNSPGTPGVLVKGISIAGVTVDPLPVPGATIAAAGEGSVVVDTERPPLDDESGDRVYYKPIQPVTVKLADANETAAFAVTEPTEAPPDPEMMLSGTVAGAEVTRDIGITLPDADNFPAGLIVWIKVVAADESKTEFYKIAVINKTHDTAVNSIKVNGTDVLNNDANQTDHIGAWLCGSTWANAAAGLANIFDSQKAAVTVTTAPRNANAKVEYTKVAANNSAAEPSGWSTLPPATFDTNDILAVKVTASNEKTVGYLKITVKVGGSAFLESLTVNNKDITLGSPKASLDVRPTDFNPYSNMSPAYRVEDGETLTGTPVSWPITATPVDSAAAVSWALVAKSAVPQDSDFNNSTSFDNSHNYLFIKVVSGSGQTMYYLVVFDERPRDTEHLKTGGKSVPIYKFTIPEGKTWGDLGDSPVLKVTMLMKQEQWDRADGYHRNFSFGEIQRMSNQYDGISFDQERWQINTGGASFQMFMPYLFNLHPKKIAINPDTGEYDQNIASVDQWFTVKYPFTGTEVTMQQPWDSNTTWDYQNSYQVLPSDSSVTYNFYPEAAATGDQYFGIGITHDGPQEYYVKALSIESADGSFKIPCDLTGGGRIDGDGTGKGYVYVQAQPTGTDDGFVREMVSDPTLK